MSDDLNQWLEKHGYGAIAKEERLSGGSINDVKKITTARNTVFCLKRNGDAPADFFTAEATGLRHLAETGAVRVPAVVHAGRDFLLLEYVAAGQKNPDYWSALGQALATLHSQVKSSFGFVENNYCGLTPQANPQSENGFDFFAEHRLMYQAERARNNGLLQRAECTRIEKLCARLASLIPAQAPALIHGDLWSGNIHCDADGAPVLIDPAAYWGWPEADLAMTTLFGEFDPAFYRAYSEQQPLESGWRDRFPLYNLYHLLNHLNHFGTSYYRECMQIVNTFG